MKAVRGIVLLVAIVMMLPPSTLAGSRQGRFKQWMDQARDRTRKRADGLKEDMRRKREEVQRRAREKAEKGSRHIQRLKDRHENKIRQKTEELRDRAAERSRQIIEQKRREVNDFARRHGSEAAEKFKQVREKYGDEAKRRIQQVARNYGSTASKAVSDAYVRHGKQVGERLCHAYSGLSGKAQDAITKAYNNYGVTTAENIAETYRSLGPRIGGKVSDAYHRWGEKAGECLKDTYHGMKEKYGDRLRKIYEMEGPKIANKFKDWNGYAKKQFLDSCELHAKPHFEKIKEMYYKYGPIVGAATAHAANKAVVAISDPKNQKKAAAATITTCIIVSRMKSQGKHTAADTLRTTCQNVHITDDRGRRVSLEKYCQNYIATNHPYLEGTSIANDPVGAFTYVVVFHDVGYVTKEMKIIRTPNGEFASMEEAIIGASPLGTEATMEALETAEAFETLTDEDVTEKDIIIAAQMLQKANARKKAGQI